MPNMIAAGVETWDLRTLAMDQALAIARLLEKVWPKRDVTTDERARQVLAYGEVAYDSAAQRPRSYVIGVGEHLIAHALVFPRCIRTSAGELTIAALASVCTDPDRRGEGLGEVIARAALGAVDAGEFPFALFQTGQRIRPFYEKLGAVIVANPITNSLGASPKGNPFWHEVVMRYPSRGEWPSGTIDLRGPGY
jgi:GNAT superfamily N-acetyltransferase